MGLATLLGGAWLAVALYRSLLSRVGGEPAYASAVVGQISQGDLAVRVDVAEGAGDSILASIGQMEIRLREVIGGIRGEIAVADNRALLAEGGDHRRANAGRPAGDKHSPPGEAGVGGKILHQWLSRVTSSPLLPTRKSRSAPRWACITWRRCSAT